MSTTGWIVVASLLFAVGYALSLAGMLADTRHFRRSMGRINFVTKGDLVFAIAMALCLPMGWLYGLKHLIGMKVDWNSPAFRRDRP